MSGSVEYRVKWRILDERRVKRFGDRDAAQALVAALGDVPEVTDVRLQARRVEAWRDVET